MTQQWIEVAMAKIRPTNRRPNMVVQNTQNTRDTWIHRPRISWGTQKRAQGFLKCCLGRNIFLIDTKCSLGRGHWKKAGIYIHRSECALELQKPFVRTLNLIEHRTRDIPMSFGNKWSLGDTKNHNYVEAELFLLLSNLSSSQARSFGFLKFKGHLLSELCWLTRIDNYVH